MSKKDDKKMSKLPQDGKTSQMDIFRTLLQTDSNAYELSNLIDLWDRIPKYHITAKQQAKWREQGIVETRKYQVKFQPDVYDVEIAPALLDIDGHSKPFFPSETEEIIESILRKFLLDQQLGIHSNRPQATWVKFSIRMIRTELKKLGLKKNAKGKIIARSRSNAEIRRSLEILTKSVLTVKKNGKRIHTEPILAGWIDKPNDAMPVGHDDALSAVRFSSLVSQSISTLNFRQYDYFKTNSFKNPVARWLMRRVSVDFRNAGRSKTLQPIAYKISLTEIVQESLLLNHIKFSKNQIKHVRNAIDELVEHNVLYVKSDDQDGLKDKETIIFESDGQTIKDIIFHFYGTQDFVKKMKAALKREELTSRE